MYRILLVDDEILVRDAIRENIDWASMDCILEGDCENGQQAAEFVKTHPVDIVLTDILMPYMDGMELSHFLHDHYPDVVIVIFSGFGEFEYAKKAIQYNVSEYMLKPVTAMELRGVIERMKEKVDQRRREKQRLESLKKTSEDYQKNASVIRFKALENLVNGTRDVNVSLSELEKLGVTLHGSIYRVAVLDIDIYSDIYQFDVKKRQESALMAFVLFNISDELVRQKDAGLVYQEGSNRVCILFSGNRTKEFSRKILKICGEIQHQFREAMGLEVSIGVGNRVRRPEDLLLSHDLAGKAMQYRYLLGGNLLIDMEERGKEEDPLLEEDLERLTLSLKEGNKENMSRALSVLEEKIRDSYAEKSRACVYLQQIIRAVDASCDNTVEDTRAVTRERDRLLRRVTEENTFRKAMGLVRTYAGKVYDAQLEMNSSSSQRQARMALDYIQKNYSDPNLSLNSICSYLNISTSYFSTIFKEATGETFTEVLIRTRMEKAKELLAGTTMKNYEIAEKVGFSDPHYFGISFKKMTGMTPTEYARENRK